MSKNITEQTLDDIYQSIDDEHIKNIKKFILFVGHAHSGHSLVGALLDAHPDAAISNHVNVPKLILEHPLSRDQLYKVILYHARQNDAQNAWNNTEYSYKIADSSQGMTSQPRILGDKQGGASTRYIRNNPQLIDQLQSLLKDHLHVIFVHRNPLDNIAAYAHYWKKELSHQHIDRYIENLETTMKIKKMMAAENWLQIEHEAFVQTPEKSLAALYDKFALQTNPTMLKSISLLINPSIKNRRDAVNWQEDQINYIQQTVSELMHG